MTQAVELLLDSQSDAAVREQWHLLEHAGLPSRARHGSTSNRPHVTVVGVADFAPEAEHQVARSCVLSHRLARAQLPRALEVLAVEDRSVVLDAARRWDGDVRREWLLQ